MRVNQDLLKKETGYRSVKDGSLEVDKIEIRCDLEEIKEQGEDIMGTADEMEKKYNELRDKRIEDGKIQRLSGPFIVGSVREDNYVLEFSINDHSLINDSHRDLIKLCEETLLVINSLKALNTGSKTSRRVLSFLKDSDREKVTEPEEEKKSNTEAMSPVDNNESKRKRKACYYQRLIDNAKVGLETTHSMPGLAKNSILQLQEEIMVREGGIIRNQYLTKLGIYGLIFSAAALLLWSLVMDKEVLIKICCMAWIGAMIGLWVNAFAEKMDIKFKDLATIEHFRIYPALKLIYVGLGTLILLLFVRSDLVTLNIGDMSLVSITKEMELQLLFGVVAGALEGSFIKRLFEQSNTIFNAQGK